MKKIASLLVLVAFGGSPLAATTYYVAVAGNDTRDGMSPTNAWQSIARVNQGPSTNSGAYQAGDQILFNCGDTFITGTDAGPGQLAPKGTGTPGSSPNPITISRYGTGAWPIIENDTTSMCPGNATIFFDNQWGWSLNRLQVTNPNGPCAVEFAINHAQTFSYFRLDNLIIYNVGDVGTAGNYGQKRSGGGILFDNGVSACATGRFDDVRITNCLVHDIGGIGIQSTADASVNQTTATPLRMTGSQILNCVVHDCDGDGIIWRAADSALIQNCTVYETGKAVNQAMVGLWIKSSENTTIQFCESYNNTDWGTDGQGFDLDIDVSGATLEYCFSHGNTGGFVLICGCDSSQIGGGGNIDTSNVVRYNVSQNDQRTDFRFNGRVQNALLYNNTLYTSGSTPVGNVFAVDGVYGGLTSNVGNSFKNNIVYLNTAGSTAAAGFATAGNIPTWSNNDFFGNISGAPAGNLHFDPLFAAAGGGSVGLGSARAYEIPVGSPAVAAGSAVSSNGGRDYIGAPVPATGAPDVGAFQYRSVSGITAPSAPTGVIASGYGPDNHIHLLWTAGSGNEEGFIIQRQPYGGGTWTQVGVAGGGQTSWIDITPPPAPPKPMPPILWGANYSYQIIGVNLAGMSSPSALATGFSYQ